MIKKLVLIALFYFFFGCDQLESANDNGFIDIKFGRTKLSIPNKYILPNFPPSIAPSEGLDDDNTILIEIPIVDLGVVPQRYGGLADKIIVLVTSLSNQVSSGALEAWDGTGLFDDRIIEYDNQVNLYRVYPKSGYPIVWQYFKSSPSSGGNFLSNWVSSCSSSPGTDGKKLSKVTCKQVHQYKTVESYVTMSGENIKELESINAGFDNLISSWETN